MVVEINMTFHGTVCFTNIGLSDIHPENNVDVMPRD